MHIKRLLAVTTAGVLMLGSIGADIITAYAAEEEEIILFSDSDEDDSLIEEGEDDSFEEEAPIEEEDFEEASDDYEEEIELTEEEEALDEEELTEVEEDLLLGEGLEEEVLDESDYTVEFIPGDGKVISSLDFGEGIVDWEYDTESGIMTVYVTGAVKVLKSVKYALIVPDGSKEFAGWYLDQSYTEKADFTKGVPVESDMQLYAKFNTVQSAEDFSIATATGMESAMDRSAFSWPGELMADEPVAESAASEEAFASEDFAVEEEMDEEPPIATASAPAPQAPKREYVSLDNAKLIGSVPAQSYRESGGKAQSVGGDVAQLFKSGSITVSIGGTKLEYVDDSKASSISKDGYYFTVSDPAAGNSNVNRYVGGDNYVTLVPTNAPDYNLVEGEYRVPFTITGSELLVQSIDSTLYYDGDPVLVYNGSGSVNNEETVKRLGAVITDSNNNVLSGDRFTISSVNDSANIGAVLVAFEGKPERGVTGRVTQNINIVRRELVKADVTVSFADKNLDTSNVPLVNGAATPEVTVKLNSNGKELVKNKDYTVVYVNNTAAGLVARIGIRLAGNYTGSLTNVLTFTVAKEVISNKTIEASAPDKKYSIFSWDGYFKSTPVLKYDDTTLKLNTDYVYVEQPTYYYAQDLVEKDKRGKVTYSRKAGQQIPDSEKVHKGAVIECRFSVIPSTTTKVFTTSKDKSGKYIPISFKVVYKIN